VVTQREGPNSVGGVEEDYLLGKLPPKRYLSDIAIKAATYIDQAVIDAVPLTFAWGTGITFQMFLNDRLGDCTCASRGHHNQVVSMRAKHPETHTDEQIFKLPIRSIGMRASVILDQGEDVAKAIEGMRRAKIGSVLVTGPDGRLVGIFTERDALNKLALGEKEGLPLEALVQALGGGAAGSWILENRSGNVIRGSYPLGFRMELHLKDLRIALAEADRLGLPMEVTRLVAEQAQRLVDAGYGGEDSSSLARVARGEIPK